MMKCTHTFLLRDLHVADILEASLTAFLPFCPAESANYLFHNAHSGNPLCFYKYERENVSESCLLSTSWLLTVMLLACQQTHRKCLDTDHVLAKWAKLVDTKQEFNHTQHHYITACTSWNTMTGHWLDFSLDYAKHFWSSVKLMGCLLHDCWSSENVVMRLKLDNFRWMQKHFQ